MVSDLQPRGLSLSSFVRKEKRCSRASASHSDFYFKALANQGKKGMSFTFVCASLTGKNNNFGNDLVAVESENLVLLGEKWGCSWGWGERKLEEPE